MIHISSKKDLVGQKYGYWTVLERKDIIRANGKHRGAWLCRCECGKEEIVDQQNLISGKSKSCGCLRQMLQSERQATHGDSNTKLYNVWCGIKRRCYNKNNIAYQRYGGRGITMCEEWLQSYESFRQWCADNGYCNGLTIDRIDNNKGYSPDNCRLATTKEQNNNKRSNREYTFNGETHNVTEWANIVGINPKTLFNRLYSGWSFERAITKRTHTQFLNTQDGLGLVTSGNAGIGKYQFI